MDLLPINKVIHSFPINEITLIGDIKLIAAGSNHFYVQHKIHYSS